ncbi:MAG: type II CAAX endopeptidase family protein [Acidimicrobiales bacterium]
MREPFGRPRPVTASAPHTGAPPGGFEAGADEPQWGIPDAVGGWLVAQVAAVFGGAVVLAVVGYNSADDILSVVAVLQALLWVGLRGAPVLAGRRKGQGVVSDFGLSFRPIDVPVGLAIGVVCQFVLVPLVSLPWLELLGKDTDDLSQPAQDLADKATDPLGVGLLVLIVVMGAPVVEELFFRGLLQRSVSRRIGAVGAVAITAVVFGLTHFQPLQVPALAAFGAVLGLLALRTGRLGPGIVAHLAFNAVTVIALLVDS